MQKALSRLSDFHISQLQMIIDEERVCPRLVELLSHSSVDVQAAALRTVGSICTTTTVHCRAIICNGALLGRLRVLVDSETPKLRQEACWALSNIAGDAPECIQRSRYLFPRVLETSATIGATENSNRNNLDSLQCTQHWYASSALAHDRTRLSARTL